MALSPEVIHRARARVGTSLNGKWRLERLLGIGGMAAVYAALHRNQKRVAIKMLHTELSVDDGIKTRFLREGYVANSVDHPGAVAVYDDDISADGAAFLVMELLHGETLEDRAERYHGKLPIEEVLPLVDQLLEVMAAAHERGVVHRDIKPDNLFLTTTGELKVLDFGIARLKELSFGDTQSTGLGSFMGTPAFMSPEQARGRWSEVDFRSDVWSVGATMFSLLTARNVHEADTVAEQLVLAATSRAPSLAVHAPQAPAAVVELVDKALAFDKAERWPGVKTMHEAVRGAMQQITPAANLMAPRVSISRAPVDREGDTIALPPELLSGVARSANPGSLSSAVTSGSEASGISKSRRGIFVALALGSIIGLGLLWQAMRPSGGVASKPAAAPTAEATPSPTSAPHASKIESVRLELSTSAFATPSASLAEGERPQTRPSASAAPTRASSAASRENLPKARSKATPVTSATPDPPRPKPVFTGDPLERRY